MLSFLIAIFCSSLALLLQIPRCPCTLVIDFVIILEFYVISYCQYMLSSIMLTELHDQVNMEGTKIPKFILKGTELICTDFVRLIFGYGGAIFFFLLRVTIK